MINNCNRNRIAVLSVLFSLFFLIVSGCSVKLISDYDEVIDKSVTELQKKVEAFLIKMEGSAGSSEGEYINNRSFYNEANVEMSAIRLRAEAIPENKITVQHINEIEKNFENLRLLHEKRGQKGLTKDLTDPIKVILNIQFKAILTLEFAKKRGK
ncbi:MAG: hypothetical protein HZA05_00895 [Nitrospirae bacterium]|nr:hypothetical protein [Nitrospirota bacterium]